MYDNLTKWLAITAVMFAMAVVSVESHASEPTNVCNHKEISALVGGAGLGVAATGIVAADSIALIAGSSGFFLVVAPAVAPIAITAGAIAATTYGGYKVYCYAHEGTAKRHYNLTKSKIGALYVKFRGWIGK